MDGEQHDAIRTRLRSRLGAGGGQYPEIAARLRKRLQKGDKGEVRGDILPVARSGDGSLSFAMPNILREAGVGLLDLMTAPSTGQLTPEATEFMVNMTPGAGATAAVRPSAVGSLGVFGGRLAKAVAKGTANQAGKSDIADPKKLAAAVRKYGEGQIKAYHASPHDFERFDLSKVGTGEGTQMEGHGLYFGQSPDVADFYQESTVKDLLARQAKAAQSLAPDQQRSLVNQIVNIVDKEGVAALDEYDPPKGFEEAWNAAAAEVKRLGGIKGTRYEVAINADLDRFHDLDKPLNQQPPQVIDAINRVGRDPRFALDQIPDDARRAHLNPLFRNPEAVDALREHGVPGLKYWDQFSRKEGEGTKNLVVFDDETIEILRKYGLIPTGVGAPSLAEAVATGSNANQQDRRN